MVNDEENMLNKVILVTGGSGLLGKAIIDQLITEGYIVCSVDVNICRVKGVVNYLCDLTSKTEIDTFIKKITMDYESIYGLVNNAYPRTNDWGDEFESVKWSSWDNNLHSQLGSVFYLTQQLIPLLGKAETSSIVNISSIYGTVGICKDLYTNNRMTLPVAYSAIKSGLNGLTKYLAAYLGEKQIRVNCVSPGGVFDNQDNTFTNEYCKRTPLGRMAVPNDIANAVAFLLSEKSSYITGQNLHVDGGYTIV